MIIQEVFAFIKWDVSNTQKTAQLLTVHVREDITINACYAKTSVYQTT
jgi:hypothetical protein